MQPTLFPDKIVSFNSPRPRKPPTYTFHFLRHFSDHKIINLGHRCLKKQESWSQHIMWSLIFNMALKKWLLGEKELNCAPWYWNNFCVITSSFGRLSHFYKTEVKKFLYLCGLGSSCKNNHKADVFACLSSFRKQTASFLGLTQNSLSEVL